MKLHDIPQRWKDRIEEDPDSDFAKKALAIQLKIKQENTRQHIATKVNVKSQVGTILADIFAHRVGAVPCSACKRTIIDLNKMSTSEIRNNSEAIVDKIEKNAQKTRAAWWAKLSMQADSILFNGKGMKYMINLWLMEACDRDDNNRLNKGLTDG